MYSIGKFAKKLGITVHTLRTWDKEDKLKSKYVSKGGHRYYDDKQLDRILQEITIKKEDRINLGYIKVSSKHQKDDLQRQYEVYELIEKIFKIHDVKIEIINQSDKKTDEQEMIDDILNIIHVFSCRMNGKRSNINKKIIKELQNDKRSNS